MKYFRRTFSKQSPPLRSRWLSALGLAAVTATLASVSVAVAEPGVGTGDNKAHHRTGKDERGARGGAGDDHNHRGAGGASTHEPGGHRLSSQADGGQGPSPHDHGAPTEAMKQRLAQLQQKDAQGTLTADERQELAGLSQSSGRHQNGTQRRARLADLKQKESAGTLTADEKTELNKAQQIQARHDALEKGATAKAQTRQDRSRDSKRQALKEYPSLGQNADATAEYQKHAERLAMLERAKDLATADQRTDSMQKIDTLIAQENQRHQTWLTQHPPTTQGSSQGAAQ